MTPVLVITGPTGCGKTALIERLFTGPRRLCAAGIVSADSMQVYHGMDIGTAKPSPSLRAAIPHYLIGIRSPAEQFNAGDFTRLALDACRAIAARGHLPVVSGGSFFYLSSLLGGLSRAPPSSPDIRAQLTRELKERGAAALQKELAECDSASAARIHINDEYRLIRALEVFRCCGQPLSAFARSAAGAGTEGAGQEWRFITIAVERERAELYRRIEARARAMMQAGLREEVAALHRLGYTPEHPGLKAIGYREFFFKDEEGAWRMRAKEPEEDEGGGEVTALIARNTRRYAKRQLTWLRSLAGVSGVMLHGEEGGLDAARDTAARLLESANPASRR